MMFFALCYPHIKFQPNRMENTEVQIFEIFDPQFFFFEKSAKAKLSKKKAKLLKLEPHRIRNHEKYF